jgi:cysteinyl-tRNA synthetase
MSLRIFNTLTGRKEEFEPLVPGEAKVYNCGPTVYDYAHIGNMRTFLFEDLLRRVLDARGYAVRHVMNITDVGHMTVDDLRDTGEDKMAVAARRLGKDPWQVAEHYTKAFFEDLDTLNFRLAHEYPRATETIPEMIALVEKLLEGGHAYVVGGDVYFDIKTFPEYGKLTGNTVEALKAGARLEVREEKRHPADFALWKSDPDHLMLWDSPWGRGYPGWHLECSVMAMSSLGESIDIHTGGEDNKFPHHECEIAQSEAATGRPFAKYWMHSSHLLVDGEKMSKSMGNFYTLRDLLEKGHEPMAIRSAVLAVQYRQPMNLTMEGIEEAGKNRDRVRELLRKLEAAEAAPDRPELAGAVTRARTDFDDALDDDLNISPARAAMLGLVSEVNRLGPPFSPPDAARIREAFAHFDDILGLRLLEEKETEPLDEEVARLVRERDEARERRDFAAADRIREDLKARGFLVEDTPDGTVVRRR